MLLPCQNSVRQVGGQDEVVRPHCICSLISLKAGESVVVPMKFCAECNGVDGSIVKKYFSSYMAGSSLRKGGKHAKECLEKVKSLYGEEKCRETILVALDHAADQEQINNIVKAAEELEL